jgi:hypothetical protein
MPVAVNPGGGGRQKRDALDYITAGVGAIGAIANIRNSIKQNEQQAGQAKLQEANKLRDEWTKLSQPTLQTADAFNKVSGAKWGHIDKDPTKSKPNPASHMSLIYGFMKMNDPSSSVKEGEYATAAQAGSLNDKLGLTSLYNRVVGGATLTPPQFDKFQKEASRLMDARLKTQDSIDNQYKSLADKRQIDHSEVLFDLRSGLDGIQQQNKQQSNQSPLLPPTAPQKPHSLLPHQAEAAAPGSALMPKTSRQATPQFQQMTSPDGQVTDIELNPKTGKFRLRGKPNG